jgi:dihydroorotate dehydrogenase electron transfer subunit
MVQTDVLVTDADQSGPFVRVTFSAPQIAPALAPGRFVLADLENYLRIPLFPARLGAEGFDVLVPPDHPAAALQPRARVDLIGPLGQGFEVPTAARRLLLVADAAYLPVLLPLARQKPSETRFSGKNLASSSVALLLSAPTAAELYPIQLLPTALEVHAVTTDGSAGHGGSALDLFPDLVRWADCVCIAGEPETYPALANIIREVRVGPGPHFAQALVVPPMACGVGACQGCAVPVAHGTRLACTDGPVFDLLELR